jgi:hypothetical protein
MKRPEAGAGANTSRVISMLRKANTAANEKTGIASQPKTKGPRPITLPTKPIIPLRRRQP